MKDKLWDFIDNYGTFKSENAAGIKTLYLPLANENLLSSVSPELRGDSKSRQDSFLLTPVSRISLTDSRESRNFWVRLEDGKVWSASGVSKSLSDIKKDKFYLEAGFLWQSITRENPGLGLKARITSFIPAQDDAVEIMQVEITNISRRKLKITPTAAIPIYARGANTLRDHRHVSSLFNRIIPDKYGVIVRPTLTFDETGHGKNRNSYFVLGWDGNFKAPEGIYPTRDLFCGDSGDLEEPLSVINNLPADGKADIQGQEAMGALRFRRETLKPRQSKVYIIVMGIAAGNQAIKKIKQKFNSLAKVRGALEKTRSFWITQSRQTALDTSNPDFDNWFRWVNIQPTLRRLFGCSFLPDFDYGKGGRGWRDLWQDCLGLLLNDPQKVRKMLLNNFSGVRIDGSNATVIGKNPGEFISDRDGISRVWMDHGAWPLLTLDLYLQETGDYNILLEEAAYFKNHEVARSRQLDAGWKPEKGTKLKDKKAGVYRGTVFEHLLVENLVQFFNVGKHNQVRLEGADWNDGLDMAKENGESVAFSAMYAFNLGRLAELLSGIKAGKVLLAQELKLLLSEFDYNRVVKKQDILEKYFSSTNSCISGRKIEVDKRKLIVNLKAKSEWMIRHIRAKEWLKEGFFNGYYDNKCKRVDGRKGRLLRMTLTSQVFPIMAGVADERQIRDILRSAHRYLLDKKFQGYRLNTDFKEEQHDLGRAFSFAYGEKENGSFFNHMVVIFAFVLYKRGFARAGWEVLNSIPKMVQDTDKSKVYPCLPEYFNAEGRGMYSYLTGSASWFILTLITEVFGVKGCEGDLCLEPKLDAQNFRHSASLTVMRNFAGIRLKARFINPRKLSYPHYKILKVSLNSHLLNLPQGKKVTIKR
ncbi:MAG TPA: cellobiose phosphorylase, partial [Candidatus Margulisiibacteriota bacterium]|nr:cellobiose phosphorylase [Candidatus Margulisiibacteriota bacterium]